jgi:hypothetical protein
MILKAGTWEFIKQPSKNSRVGERGGSRRTTAERKEGWINKASGKRQLG